MPLTPRAMLAGLALGILLAAGNVYMGLRTGFWEIGVVTASVLAAALLRRGGRRADPVEATLAQSVATAMGVAPAATGLLGAVPGLALLGLAPPSWTIALLGVGAGGLGIGLAHAVRRRLLDTEALPFPSGVAAAEVLQASGSGARPLVVAGALSAALTALRDAGGRVPAALLAPGRAGALGAGLAVSPMLVGVGALIGLGAAGSLALGSAIAWGGFVPEILRRGAVAGSGYADLAGWLQWPGVGLMLGGAAASLASDVRAFRGGVADLAAAARGAGRTRAGAVVAVAAGGSAVLAVVAAHAGFGLGVAAATLSLLPALVATVTCARAAGRTDLAPSGELGQVVQAGAGALGAGAAGGAGAGAIATGAAAQGAVSLWSLRAGSRVGASPAAQAAAQLFGLVLGAGLAVPIYALLVRAHGLGSAVLPAPTAIRWRALAELAGGSAAVPPGAAVAGAVAFVVGLALEAAGRGPLRGRVPGPGAIGLGFMVPAHYAAAMLLGAVLGALAVRRGRAAAVEPVAAGAIAGESLAALAAAAVTALRM